MARAVRTSLPIGRPWLWAGALLGVAGGLPALAGPPFAKPVDCRLGETCFIQQYVDRDPGPGAADFTCGPLSYDGHDGTDFALPSLAAMQDGVAVLAVAAGTVLAVRDGMADIASNAPDAPDIDGRECGNGVLIDHAGGWQSQYCHLRRGSVLVAPGDAVAVGAPLGLVGLSGQTEFPHLHLTLRHEGTTVDPFLPDPAATCGSPAGDTLWDRAIPYVAGDLIDIGFATAVPDYAAIRAGQDSPDRLAPSAPALVLWAYAFGGRAGDRVILQIEGPRGAVIDHSEVLERNQAQFFRAAGRRQSGSGGWPEGSYTGIARVQRDGAVLAERQVTLRIAR